MASPLSCNIDICKRSSHGLCYCCEQNLCIVHLKEHSDLLNAQLVPLADEINNLFDLLSKVSPHQSISSMELDKWCYAAHRTIDLFCEKKKRECEELVGREQNELKIEFDRLRKLINELNEEQGATREHINTISNSLRTLQQETDQFLLPQVTLSPLVINDHLVAIRKKKPKSNDLLPLPQPCQTFEGNVNWVPIVASDDHILIGQMDKLRLLDQRLVVQKEIPWTHGELYDIIWMKTPAKFTLIAEGDIFLLDEKITTVEQFPLGCNSSINCWWRGTYSSDTLFLATWDEGSSIFVYNLRSSNQFVKEYRSPVSCKTDETIHDLKSNIHTLALVITNQQNKVRLDLCSRTTLVRHWSIELDLMYVWCRTRCCSLSNDQWLVIDANKSELLHISVDGKLVKKVNHSPSPWNAIQLNNNVLAISTRETINLYQLP